MSVDPDKGLLWRCRRGTKELDVLLDRYVHGPYTTASSDERHAFDELLSLPDDVLADYLFGHATPPQAHLASLARLIAGRVP